MITVKRVTAADLEWHFENGPRFLFKDGTYQSACTVDPFPCYAHDAEVAVRQMSVVEGLFPLSARRPGEGGQVEIRPIEPTLYISEFESINRCNGQCHNGSDWATGGTEYWESTSIILHGKRTPPMPALTRYLAAHEYGHAVERMLLDSQPDSRRETVLKDYARMRGVEYQVAHGGRTWHSCTAEIFACDFRVLVAGVEPDFWPHPGITPPEQVPGLVQWWVEQSQYARQLRG
jgi:hypothetical protein